MKYIDRFINFVFSLFILFVSAFVAFIAAGLIEYNAVSSSVGDFLFCSDNRTITCIVAIIVFLAALKTTVFLTVGSNKKKNGILVDTNNGKVQIAQETIENTAKSVVLKYDSVKDAEARMTKEKRGVNVYMSLLVYPTANIIELTSKAQDEVKSAIEGSTGVRVNNVDIKVKNVSDNKAMNKAKKVAPKAEVVPEVSEAVKEVPADEAEKANEVVQDIEIIEEVVPLEEEKIENENVNE